MCVVSRPGGAFLCIIPQCVSGCQEDEVGPCLDISFGAYPRQLPSEARAHGYCQPSAHGFLRLLTNRSLELSGIISFLSLKALLIQPATRDGLNGSGQS